MPATLSETHPSETFPDASDAWSDLAILVRLAQAGDREAFGQLVEQFERTVYAVCLRRLGNPSEAIELTQEVFLHAMERIGQLREPERFAGWLRQVAGRMAINRATRRVPTPTVEADVLERAGEVLDDPLRRLIARERAEAVREGLARLKHIDREALDAFYLQGQSLVEIADRLDAPVGTIKRRLHTARKRLRAELVRGVMDGDEWTESGAGGDADEGDVALSYAACV